MIMSIHCVECGTFLYSQHDGGYATWIISAIVGPKVTKKGKTICRSCFNKIKGNELKEPLESCFMIDTKDAFEGAMSISHNREFMFYDAELVRLIFSKSYKELHEISQEDPEQWLLTQEYCHGR